MRAILAGDPIWAAYVFAPDGVAVYQLDDGYFIGIEQVNGALAAAGGTDIVFRADFPEPSERKESLPKCGDGLNRFIARGVAAIGNVFTKPDLRGRGYARAVASAIVTALRADGYGLIVLNVDKRNTAARSLYEKLGFATPCRYLGGGAARSGNLEAVDGNGR